MDASAVMATVPISKIRVKHNYRPKSPERETQVKQLAENIAAVGLLQPVGVVAFDEGYELVFGEKRLDAYRVLERKEIPAMVFESATEAENHVRQLAENTHRSDPSPMAQAIAVADLLDNEAQAKASKPYAACTRPVKDECIAAVAAALSVSEAWVSDRAYLTLLSENVQAMVADESLPLAHAREIAKVRSHDEQEVIANLVKRGAKDERPASIQTVKELCGRKIMSLRHVPWLLSESFAGRISCEQCPCNTANDPKLFGTTEASCSDRACFNAKRREADRAIAKATADVLDDLKANKAKHRAIEARKPEFVTHEAIVASVSEALEVTKGRERIAEQAAKGSGALSAKERREKELRKEAERQFALLAEQRAMKVNASMRSWFAKDHKRALLWELVCETKIMVDASSCDHNSGGRAARSPGIRRAITIAKQEPETALDELNKLRFSKHGMAGYRAFDERSFAAQRGVPDLAADILDVEVPGEPLPEREAWIGQYVEMMKKGGGN